MKVRYEVTRIEKVEKEVPDRFGFDETLTGKIVDILLESKRCRERDLYSNNPSEVDHAVNRLTDAYKKADKIVELIKEESIVTES